MTTEERSSAQARFGTFGGVFTPCVLTILGVIMFMRAGYVVGDAGLLQALIILLIAKSITTLTTLSLSAIATNTEVRTGGVYYMISRTLGPDFGGAIGLTLFVSQAVSIAFYVIGFSEALFSLFAPAGSELRATLASYHVEQLASTATIVLLFFVTFKGADLAIRAQYGIFAVLMLSVVAFVFGGLSEFDAGRLSDNITARDGGASFWVLFAIFFPAATGITAGANMSGDLKDPGESIPKGTLVAIAFTGTVYLIELVLLAGFVDRGPMAGADQQTLDTLSFQNLKDMAWLEPLIAAGVFAATLSSALGSFLGAPRIMQAMGKDRLLVPLEYFGQGHGPSDEPRRATVLSLIIAVAIVWMGGLNAVAQVISMFFLIAYGMINFSAFVEGYGGNPSFRPRFKLFGWPAALVGAIGCVIAMVKIDETYALVAIGISTALYFWLRRRTTSDWGDAKRGYIFSRTRQNLLTLENMSPDPKNWRPVLMVLTEDADRDRQLIQCAAWIEASRGLLSVLEVSEDAHTALDQRLRERQEHMARIHKQLHGKNIVAFADSVVVPDAIEHLDAIVQAYSIGSLRPNTLIMSIPPPNQPERRARVARMMATIAPFGLNVVLYKGARMDSTRARLPNRLIDVWWHGQKNGSLLALFAYLAQTHPDWNKATIRMLRIVASGQEHVEAERSLRSMMAAARLAVRVEVILSPRPAAEIIAEKSADSDLVLMGLREQDVADMQSMLAARDSLLAQLPPTLLVLSNGEADLLA